jgi:small multidrug resistance pump
VTAWPWLAGAILSEVSATLALRAATDRPAWSVLTAVGYTASFVLLAAVLRRGMAVGVAYGVWAASGIALTAVIARVAFGEPLTRTMGAGIALVALGVLLVEPGAASH